MENSNDKAVGTDEDIRRRGSSFAIFTALSAARRARRHRPRIGKARARSVTGLFLVHIIAACSGGGTAGSPESEVAPAAVAPSITAQPQNTTVTVGQAASFTVTATGAAPLAYQWRSGGSAIAGATAASYTTAATSAAESGEAFSVVITNSAGTVTSGSAILTVNPASTSPLSITTSTLPGGFVQSAYTDTLQATGGKTPYAWTVVSGQLPAGLVLSKTTGMISGTPATVENSSFTVSVHDAAGASATLCVVGPGKLFDPDPFESAIEVPKGKAYMGLGVKATLAPSVATSR